MRTVIILILSASAMFGQTSKAPERKAGADLQKLQSEEKVLEKKLADLQNTYKESHPYVIKAKRELYMLLNIELLENQALLRDGPATQAERAAASQRIREVQQQMTTDRLADEAQAEDAARRLHEVAADAQQLLREKQAAEAAQARAAQAQKASGAEKLAKIKAAEADLEARLARLSDQHPDVLALRLQLETLRKEEKLLLNVRSGSPSVRNITPEDIARLPVLPTIPDSGQTPFSPIPLSPLDRWWRNNSTSQSLGLSSDQQQRMDDVLQQYRLKLVDVSGALQKEEIALEPLVGADRLDETKITAQIDRVAQARAELEKVNGRMLLQIRKQLTPEQWRKLNQPAPGARP